MPKRRIHRIDHKLPFLLISLLATFSCVSIRMNYLGPDDDRWFSSDSSLLSSVEKKDRHELADSLLQIIDDKRYKNRYLRAQEINLLYSSFGEQLDNDRYYNHILQQPIQTDSLTSEQYNAVLQLLSSATSYDKTYQQSRVVRRSINRGEAGNQIPEDILQKSRTFLYSPDIRKIVTSQHSRYPTPETDSLMGLLPKTNFSKALRYHIFRGNDRLHSFLNFSAYTGSYAVGNTIGMFNQTSSGEKNAMLLKDWLQPFDLILLKSTRHLTDQFIPGYFGHVGIWLGEKAVRKVARDSIEVAELRDKTVMEVLRSGVTFSTLSDFADGEDFLVLRFQGLTASLREHIIRNLRKQVGKGYDFNFNIESPDYLSCTELVYLSYDFIDWQPRYTWLRFTLSPDDLVFTVLEKGQFEFPVYIENEKIIPSPDCAMVSHLVNYPAALEGK